MIQESILGMKTVNFVAEPSIQSLEQRIQNRRQPCRHSKLQIKMRKISGCNPVPVVVCACGKTWSPESANTDEAEMIRQGFELAPSCYVL